MQSIPMLSNCHPSGNTSSASSKKRRQRRMRGRKQQLFFGHGQGRGIVEAKKKQRSMFYCEQQQDVTDDDDSMMMMHNNNTQGNDEEYYSDCSSNSNSTATASHLDYFDDDDHHHHEVLRRRRDVSLPLHVVDPAANLKQRFNDAVAAFVQPYHSKDTPHMVTIERRPTDTTAESSTYDDSNNIISDDDDDEELEGSSSAGVVAVGGFTSSYVSLRELHAASIMESKSSSLSGVGGVGGGYVSFAATADFSDDCSTTDEDLLTRHCTSFIHVYQDGLRYVIDKFFTGFMKKHSNNKHHQYTRMFIPQWQLRMLKDEMNSIGGRGGREFMFTGM